MHAFFSQAFSSAGKGELGTRIYSLGKRGACNHTGFVCQAVIPAFHKQPSCFTRIEQAHGCCGWLLENEENAQVIGD